MLLDDEKAVRLADDELDRRNLVPPDDREPVALRAHGLVLVLGEHHPLGALSVAALADEIQRPARRAEALLELPHTLVHVAEQRLVHAHPALVLVHPHTLAGQPLRRAPRFVMFRSMRRLVVLGTMVALTAACGGGGTGDEGEGLPPYADRLELAQTLAVQYPGDVAHGEPLGEFGFWAGIIVQTRWQDESGRDEIALWSLLNQTLSVEPSAYAAELASSPESADPAALCASSAYGRDHPTTAADGPSVDRADVCEAWMSYFVAHRQGSAPATLQELLWDAHTVALVHGLRENREAIDGAATTNLERNFWASWFEIVFLLDALNFPTEGASTVRASNAVMPTCAPIGEDGCELTQTDLGDSYAFVSALATRPASIERIFDLYELGRLNPAALLVPRDLSLARALSEYLRGAQGARG